MPSAAARRRHFLAGELSQAWRQDVCICQLHAARKSKSPAHALGFLLVAEWTGLEPATPGVTGRYSNQLNYHSALAKLGGCLRNPLKRWRPHGDSNPGYRRERAVS